MTKEAEGEFLAVALETVAMKVAAKEEFPKKLADGTAITATPADIGFDEFTFPSWMTASGKVSVKPSEMDQFEESLLELLAKSKDRSKALNSLMVLSESLQPSEFSGTIIPRKADADYPKETIWIEIKYSDGPSEKMPLRFKKVQDAWKYNDVDWDLMDAEDLKFSEKKVLEISGKDVDGNEISIKGLNGKVVLIDFWGTW